MQNFSFRYARWLNNKKREVGHVFQSRYKAILVDKESYLLELVRYIHLNPVRAGLVDDVKDYRWCSHGAYLGQFYRPWLTTGWILTHFGNSRDLSISRYLAFMNSPADRDVELQLAQGMVGDDRLLGTDEFVDEVLYSSEDENKPYNHFDDLVQHFCGRYGVSIEELGRPTRCRRHARIRAEIGFYSLKYNLSTLTEVAAYFNRDATTLSKRIRKLLIEEHSEASQ